VSLDLTDRFTMSAQTPRQLVSGYGRLRASEMHAERLLCVAGFQSLSF
jgi:hypothetical protein